MKVGIDAISLFTPTHQFPVRSLASLRDLDPDKLEKGLGLRSMSMLQPESDARDMAAQALLQLFQENSIDTQSLGRVYLGSESHHDGAKPTASYALSQVETALGKPGCFNACDVVDLTFACIAGVDALLSCVEYVRLNPGKTAIAVATDIALYEEGSAGEYTQGAAAVAIWVTENPRLLSIENQVGVGYASVEDFHKPLQVFDKQEIAQDLLNSLGLDMTADWSKAQSAFWNNPKSTVATHRIEPTFDGPFSNECYTQRLGEALARFEDEAQCQWVQHFDKLAFHLPYAFQGRRMGSQLWVNSLLHSGSLAPLEAEIGPYSEDADWTKKASKSELYKAFVASRMKGAERASGEMGNGYTTSIFIALLGIMAQAIEEGESLDNKTQGFFAYGSGSKGKVFQGTYQSRWAECPSAQSLWKKLSSRTELDAGTYLDWHRQRY
jgi:hydroxymethylglutaryl-CoA synthase